jgi:integrase
MRWDDIDLTTGRLHVRRAKGGDASVHPISARESRALRKLLREAPTSPYVFISERRARIAVISPSETPVEILQLSELSVALKQPRCHRVEMGQA